VGGNGHSQDVGYAGTIELYQQVKELDGSPQTFNL
jgi:hypothetical protein